MTATPIASKDMSAVVTTTTLRKLRSRTRSRSAAELAARTVVTILPRSALTTCSPYSSKALTFVSSRDNGLIRIIDAEPSGDPLELLPRRVGRREMALHMPEQARHLAKHVAGRREVENLRLRGVEVA